MNIEGSDLIYYASRNFEKNNKLKKNDNIFAKTT